LTQREDRSKEHKPKDQKIILQAKDYVALMIAMAETTLLPLILLAIVLAILGISISILLFH
jgi:hypothetical protein